MSEVHHPRSFPRSVLAFVGEVGMISLAVFLGLLADQWRESRHQQESARAALRNFRAEITTNQEEIERLKDYHVQLRRDLIAFQARGAEGSMTTGANFDGIKPVNFEHTAWDLAIATQALSYVDTELAYEVSKIYTHQQAFENFEHAFMQGVFSPSTFSNANRAAAIETVVTYLNDVVNEEPALLKLYDSVIPRLNMALADGKS